ncbi:BTB/POZ and MATH domain-containing protein 2-like [Triticum dicoccoides]|uniref:BTB/POZ and MATH domain-containing protein 2-like n=1 Tax=Triticum dicoccoides TaxID=85692 RepID=UPI0018916956|nr:BTB/POZ and MATH domain-containing protein 2-like [Triticum dicoccoides]XP_044392307.1 BTB/POZ and MATH domain-containing protein 2-like [Triticum aestivum]
MAEQCKISAAMVSEERSYVLKVDGYSRAKALVKNGQCVISTSFSVGGHNWVVRYYPNGFLNNYAHSISLYLCLESTDVEDMKAEYTLAVLDKNGEPVPSYSCSNPLRIFSDGSAWSYPLVIKKADLEASAHLRDNCLTIRCNVTIMQIKSEEAKVSPSDLHHHLADLLKNKDAADLTFEVGAQSFSAHRCVLAARSSVFKAELLGAKKESSAASTIKIHDMEADVFKSLLHFIYTDSVPVLEMGSNKSETDVVMAGHLLVAADRYNIVRLKQICEEKLCNHIGSRMVGTSLALAEQHGFHRLKEACLRFLASPSNFEAMVASDGYEHLRSSCPSVLKELIARILPAEWKVAKDILTTT